MENKEEQGLQKLTVSELKKVKEIQIEDFEKLNKDERIELMTYFNDLQLKSKGVEKDKVFKKVWNVLEKDVKNDIWEYNHETILLKMHKHIIDNGRMPLMRDLETSTELSRQTITKHLKEYKESELYSDYKEQYKMLHSKVLDVVYKISMTGDIKACKLFLEATGEMIKANTYIDKQQNNHTQNNFSPIVIEIIPPLND
jgi:hypothetical protein